jgi:hypothetical protein
MVMAAPWLVTLAKPAVVRIGTAIAWRIVGAVMLTRNPVPRIVAVSAAIADLNVV